MARKMLRMLNQCGDLAQKYKPWVLVFTNLTAITLIMWKVRGVITWSWAWVLFPFWLPFLLIAVVLLLILLVHHIEEDEE